VEKTNEVSGESDSRGAGREVEEEVFSFRIFGVDDVLGLEGDPIAIVRAHVGADRKLTTVKIVDRGQT